LNDQLTMSSEAERRNIQMHTKFEITKQKSLITTI
jgi:hypothetical protein